MLRDMSLEVFLSAFMPCALSLSLFLNYINLAIDLC